MTSHRDTLRRIGADVVVHMAAFRRDETRDFVELLDGFAGRVVGISSIDVYAAYARLKRSEPGPLQKVPIPEDGELRKTIEPQGEDYDKLGVEAELMACPKTLPATVIRYPGVYGPRDGLRRLYPYLRRMDDDRPFILVDKHVAGFRFSKAYSENAARAVVLAVTSERAAGRVYNVSEQDTQRECDWIRQLGTLADWHGEIIQVEPDQMPDGPEADDVSQDWVVDSGRIRDELGFDEVVAPDEGIQRTIAWERAQPRACTLYPIDYDAEDLAYARVADG